MDEQKKHAGALGSTDGLGPWVECPRMTRWGAGMVAALVAVTKDETARVIASEDAAPMVADAIVSAVRKPLTRQQIDDVMTQHYPLSSLLREEVDAFEACVRDIERLHGIGA